MTAPDQDHGVEAPREGAADDRREDDALVAAVRAKADRMARARRDKRSVWVVLAHAGAIGWQFILPFVGFTLIGHGISQIVDSKVPTLLGILVGLLLGLWLAGRSLRSGVEP